MAKIMIADDSDAIRTVLQDIIAISEHQYVGSSVDGQETIDMYKSLKPDILLLDLAMPKKNGLEVIKEIMIDHPEAKIIVVTASDNQKVISECIECGAKTHIVKPFDFDNVLKIINSVASQG